MAKLAFGENTGNAARLGLVTEQPWLQCILASFRVFVIKVWALAKNQSLMYAFRGYSYLTFAFESLSFWVGQNSK